jgi:hypothetical protein
LAHDATHAEPTAPSAAPVKPLAEPVAAVEVTKMPLPQGRCAGKYTEEARAAATDLVAAARPSSG